MIIIGDRLNCGIKSVRIAVEEKDTTIIQEIAKNQFEAGASHLDINAQVFGNEEDKNLQWIIQTVQNAVEIPVSISSCNWYAIEQALKKNKVPGAIINYVSCGDDDLKNFVALAKEYSCGIIALCSERDVMPECIEERLESASNVVGFMESMGIDIKNIYLDPVVRPVGVGACYGKDVLDTIKMLSNDMRGASIICALSNISFGMPERKLINQAFLVAAMTCGLSAVILDPLDKKLMALLYAAQAVLGKDEFCSNYLMKFREGLLE